MASDRRDNSEGNPPQRKQVKEALRKSKEQYHLLAENVTDVIYTMDMDLRLTYVSSSITRQLGYSVEEVMPLSLEELLTPASLEVAMKAWAEELAIEEMEQKDINRSRVLELELRCKDGSTVWTEMSIVFLRDPDGMAVGILGVTRDISDRKRAEEALREARDVLEIQVEERTAALIQEIEERKCIEEALRESEERYRTLFDSVIDGVVVIDGKTMKIVLANQTALKMYGSDSVEDMNKLNLLDHIHPDDRERVVRTIAEDMFEKDLRQVNEFRAITKDGQEKWFSTIGAKIEYQGKPAGLVSFRDITERKRAEEALRKSEEQYRLLAENVTDVIWTMDMDLRYTYVSPSVTRLRGYSVEETMAGSIEDVLTPESLEVAAKIWDEELAIEEMEQKDLKRSRLLELELRCKDGSTVWTEMSITGIRDADGKGVGILGVTRDITERKRVGEALRESESKYRFLYEGSPAVSLIIGMDGCIKDANTVTLEKLGYTKEEDQGIYALDLVVPEHREKAAMLMDKALRGEYTPEADLDIYAKDGSTRTILLSAGQLVLYEKGQPTAILISGVDVTERKLAEEALRESEGKYRALVDHMEEGYMVFYGGRIKFANRRCAEVIGVPVEQLIGANYWEYLAPESREQARQTYETLKVGGKVAPIQEYVYMTEDGRRIPVEVSMREVIYEGKPGYAVVLRDITERKRAEEALRESEDKVRNIFESVSDGIFAIDLNNIYTEANERMVEMHGFSSKDEILGKNAFELVAPDIDRTAMADMKRALEQGSVANLEYIALKRDGSEFPAEVNTKMVKDAFGNPVGFIGIVRDITEHRKAEEALQHSEQHFRALTENALDGVVIVNPDITIQYLSPSMERITGRKVEERIGRDPLEFCHPDDNTKVAEAFLQLLDNQIPTVHTEFRYRHKNGRWRTLEVVGTNLIDNPAVAGIVLNMRDITERKRAEQKVHRLMEELEQRVVERTRQLHAVNKELEAFAYSVSHDLRAPLRSIDGFSQVLLEDYTNKLDEEGRDYLQRVRSASQRMAELIDDLLNLSRVTRGEMRYETVDLSALAQTITMELQQSQPERDVEFTIAPGLVAKGDARLLHVALENLLGNAWKFAGMQAPARIEFGYAETNGQPAYFVRDNGVGFDMAYADKLFGAFQRLHSHNEFEGTGIGLATVQRIINRHGGNIWAESAVGQGATFYFTLKL